MRQQCCKVFGDHYHVVFSVNVNRHRWGFERMWATSPQLHLHDRWVWSANIVLLTLWDCHLTDCLWFAFSLDEFLIQGVLVRGYLSVFKVWVQAARPSSCFSVFLLRPGLDGITLFPLMTVKTVTETEGTADPHPTLQLPNHSMHARTHVHTHTHTHTLRRKQVSTFSRCYGILGFLMECLCVCVFCFTTLRMF